MDLNNNNINNKITNEPIEKDSYFDYEGSDNVNAEHNKVHAKKVIIETLNLARRIAMYNGEAIYYLKNRLLLMDVLREKELSDKHEKLNVMIKTEYPNTNIDLILANYTNNDNHNIMLYEIDLIQDSLLEGLSK